MKLTVRHLVFGVAGLAAIPLSIFHGAQVHAQDEAKAAALPGSAALPDLQPNPDWQRVELSGADGLEGRAWSDPAGGCHLALFSLPVPDTASDDKIFESLSTTLAKSDYLLSKSETDTQPPQLLLTGFGVEGIATLDVPKGQDRRASLLACYWNRREPSYCRSLCESADKKMRIPSATNDAEAQQ